MSNAEKRSRTRVIATGLALGLGSMVSGAAIAAVHHPNERQTTASSEPTPTRTTKPTPTPSKSIPTPKPSKTTTPSVQTAEALFPAVPSHKPNKIGKGQVIVLDAARSGGKISTVDKQTGLVDKDFPGSDSEKAETFVIAQMVAQNLKADGFNPVQTKKTENTTVNARQRVEAARAAKAALVVSLFADHSADAETQSMFVPKLGANRGKVMYQNKQEACVIETVTTPFASQLGKVIDQKVQVFSEHKFIGENAGTVSLRQLMASGATAPATNNTGIATPATGTPTPLTAKTTSAPNTAIKPAATASKVAPSPAPTATAKPMPVPTLIGPMPNLNMPTPDDAVGPWLEYSMGVHHEKQENKPFTDTLSPAELMTLAEGITRGIEASMGALPAAEKSCAQ